MLRDALQPMVMTMMESRELRILHLEDNLSDVELIRHELIKGNLVFDLLHVRSQKHYLRALEEYRPDIILADYNLPGFNGLAALKLLRAINPDLPFILVSGFIGEESAVEIVRSGATDYILKDRLSRLIPSVNRALREADERLERTRTEQQLRESEEQFRLICENVTDLISVINIEGKRIYNCPSSEALLGQLNLSTEFDPFAEIHPDDRDYARAVFRKTVETGEGQRAEYRFLLESGAIRHIESQWNLIRTFDAKPLKVVVISRDVTDRIQTQEALRRSEEYFRSLIENTSDIIAVLNGDASVRYESPSIRRVLGFHPEEVVGKHASELIHPRDLPRVLPVFQEMMENGRTTRFIEFRHRHKDGSWRVMEATMQNLLDDPIVSGIVINYRDITGRREAEETLRLLSSAIRNSNDLVMMTEAGWSDGEEPRVVYINEAFSRITGYESADIVGGSPRLLEGPATDGRQSQKILDALRGHSPVREEIIYHAKNGAEFWLEMSIIPVRNEQGDPTHYVMLGREVTERKRTQEALLESERKLRQIIDLVPHLIFLKSADGRYLLANKALGEFFGISTDNLVGKRLEEIAPLQAEAPLFQEDDIDVVKTGKAKVIPERFFTGRGGKRHILHITKIPFRHHTDADVSAVLGIAIDITEQKDAEEKIREQAALLDIATDAIIVRTMDDRIAFWSKGAEAIYGWKAEESLGKHTRDLMFKNNLAQFEEAEQTVVRRDKWMGELQQVTKGNSTITVQSRWTRVRDEKGNPKSILILNTDITAMKKYEAQFLRAQRMESIGTLAGGIAHDLNNVLAPILLTIQNLKRKLPDERSQRMLTTLESSTKRGADMVHQVLTFARGVEGERSIIQPRHLIEEIEKIARETFTRSIRVIVRTTKELWSVNGNATQLHQVLMNLCVNARDAMPGGGTLTIDAENVLLDENFARMHIDARAGNYVMITVADTGSGIPQENIDKIFEPFFTTKEVGKGTGLGLSTVMAIVKGHGGFISVYSEVGKGTKFKVYVPAVVAAETVQGDPNAPSLPTGNGEAILVVDDEASICEITKETLETFGYHAMIANDGTEAIALFAQNKGEIKAVLTDMMMPFMDGPATIRALKKIDPDVKIIAASGLITNDKADEAGGATGVQAFLLKPYTAETLLKTLEEVLKK